MQKRMNDANLRWGGEPKLIALDLSVVSIAKTAAPGAVAIWCGQSLKARFYGN